jgi:hypothetical protein
MTSRLLRRNVLVAVVMSLVFVGGGAAWAFWTASGSGNASAAADSLPAGATPTATAGATTVGVSFNVTKTTLSNTPASDYVVTRYTSPTGGTGVVATCPLTIGATTVTCTDAPGAGTWYYTDSPKLGTNWIGAESARSTAATISASATKLVITSAAVTGQASATATLGPITVQQQNAAGNPVNAGAGGVVVGLASNSTGTARFAATSGGTGVFSVTIPSGSNSVNFFYGDTKAGGPTITVSSGVLTSGNQSETITGGPLASFTVTNPGTQTAGTPFNVTVKAIDASGNPAAGWTSATGCVLFSGAANSPNSTVPIYPVRSTCSASPAGQSLLTFDSSGQASATVTLFKATTATTNLTVKDSGQVFSGSTGNFAVNSKGVALAYSPTLPTTVPKNGSKAFSISVPLDQYGNAFTSVAGVAVTLTLTPTTGSWAFDGNEIATASTTTVTITSGPATNTFTVFEANSSNGRTATLSATTSAPGFTAPPTGTLTSSP